MRSTTTTTTTTRHDAARDARLALRATLSGLRVVRHAEATLRPVMEKHAEERQRIEARDRRLYERAIAKRTPIVD